MTVWVQISRSDIDGCTRVPQSFIVDLFRGLIDQQEWSDSGSVSQRVLRSYLLLFACVRNYGPCVTRATQLFNQWRDSDGTMRSEVTAVCETAPSSVWTDVFVVVLASPLTSPWPCLWLELARGRGGTSCMKNTVRLCRCLWRAGWSRPWPSQRWRTSSSGESTLVKAYELEDIWS